jgi:cytochrome c-type biogenesis protein CcmE
MTAPIDRELAEELERVAEQTARATSTKLAAAEVSESGTSPRPAEGRRRIGLVITVLSLALLVLGVVLFGVKDAVVYSKEVDQLFVERERLRGRPVRALGTLVTGSLRRRDQPCEYRFELERRGQRMMVRYPECVIPDTMRDVPGAIIEVTVEGTPARERHLPGPSDHRQVSLQIRGGTALPLEFPGGLGGC